METLGGKIRSLRAGHDLTLREFARKVGASATHISDIENGLRKPSRGLLLKMAKALKVVAEELQSLGTGVPVEELRDAVRREPALGFALMKVAEERISAVELLDFIRTRKACFDKKKKAKRIEMKQRCKRCGWEWESHVEKPIRCARCRSQYWDVEPRGRGRKVVGVVKVVGGTRVGGRERLEPVEE